MIIAGIVIILAFAQLFVLGAMGGIGPLKFIRNSMMAKLPGNAEQYHPTNVTPMKGSPLAETPPVPGFFRY